MSMNRFLSVLPKFVCVCACAATFVLCACEPKEEESVDYTELCSASGDALFKLYRATGRVEYVRLAQQVVHALPQFLSHPARPIHGMEVVGMSERVNLGDWEGHDQVGEIGNAPCACWPEVALLLARVQLPGVYARTDTREILCFDQLESTWEGDALRITNPTDYPAEATLLVEDSETARQPLSTTAYERFRKIAVPAHNTVTV